MNTFHPNDVLIDQTMVCEASRLLEKYPSGSEYVDLVYDREKRARLLNKFTWPDLKQYPQIRRKPGPSGWYTSIDRTPEGVIAHNLIMWPPTNSERLVHLSLLLDALALHEKTYVLKGELPPDAPSLELRNILIANGIMVELDTEPFADSIKRDFENLFNVLDESDNRVNLAYDENIPIRVINSVVRLMTNEPPNELDTGIWKCLSQLYDSNYQFGSNPKRLLKSDNPLIEYGRSLVHEISGWPYTRFSGSELAGISNLRTLIYSRVSDHGDIVLYPSLRRIPLLEILENYKEKRIAEQVYAAVAKAFESNIEEVFSDNRHFPIYLPPTLAVFLEIYDETPDLRAALKTFRDTFADCRLSFRTLEERLQEASDFESRCMLKRQIGEATRAIKCHYEYKEDSFLKSAIGFAPEVINPLLNPADPRAYSSNLLSKPIEWIKKWWIKRPLKHVFRLRDRINNTIKYEDWASDVIGVRFNEDERKEFWENYERYLRNWNSFEEFANGN